NLRLRPVADPEHGDDGADANNDPEGGQSRSQLISQKRPKRYLDRCDNGFHVAVSGTRGARPSRNGIQLMFLNTSAKESANRSNPSAAGRHSYQDFITFFQPVQYFDRAAVANTGFNLYCLRLKAWWP